MCIRDSQFAAPDSEHTRAAPLTGTAHSPAKLGAWTPAADAAEGGSHAPQREAQASHRARCSPRRA
eukprot:724927-Alexandrium_andersonii.AAC.1